MDESQLQRQPTIPSCFRLECAREWGPCILGIDQAVRGLLSIGPPVFCGVIVPCVHEPSLQTLCLQSGVMPSTLAQLVQSDSYIAWLLRRIPSEMADGARCSMGILEHTTASALIKEAIAAGIDIRCIRVSTYSDPVRFRQFLYEAFPMIDNICVYPRVVTPQPSTSPSPSPSPSLSPSSTESSLMVDSSDSSSDGFDSVGSSHSSCISMPPIITAAGIIAHSARDELSRHLLFRQRHIHTRLAPSPLSKSVNGLHKREHYGTSPCSLLGEPMYRSRPSLDEDSERATVRCVPFVGSEFGEAQCGYVSSSLPPQRSLSSQTTQPTQPVPISMYDFYDDDESDMIGLTSPKRIRVVPCSPTLTTVFTCDDSIPSICSSSSSAGQKRSHSTQLSGTNTDHLCSPPYVSSSLYVSPPFGSSCSTASTSVPMFHSMLGMTSPI